jgi:hypothetical protein
MLPERMLGVLKGRSGVSDHRLKVLKNRFFNELGHQSIFLLTEGHLTRRGDVAANLSAAFTGGLS